MKSQTNTNELPMIVTAALAYFALVFGAGFILGPIRILFIVPRFGVRVAELIEFPIMLAVIVVAAKWLVRKFQLLRKALLIGFLALGLMIVFEFTLVLWLRGLTLTEYFRERDPVSGVVYYLMLLVFAVMPFFLERRAHLGKQHDSLHR
jgi:hypothetical protein